MSETAIEPVPMITATQAARTLGVGHNKIAKLLKAWKEGGGKEGLAYELQAVDGLTDRRMHLIKQSDVEALREASQGMIVREARKALGVSKEKMQALIKSGELPVRPHPLDKRQRLVDPASYQALLAKRKALPIAPRQAARREQKAV